MEPSIFERNIEVHRARSPQQAIDVSVPPVLDDAASAIVQESSTLEIVQPDTSMHALQRSPSTQGRYSLFAQPLISPAREVRGQRRNASGDPYHENGMAAPSSQQQMGRQRGHRRPLSDASNVFTSMPSRHLHPDMHTERPADRRSPLPTASAASPSHARSYSIQPSTSPSLSIDGAIIAGNDVASQGVSLDGLADAFVHMATTPGEPVQTDTPRSRSSRQTSYFAQTDAPHNVHESPAYPAPPAFHYQVLPQEGEHPLSRSPALTHGAGPTPPTSGPDPFATDTAPPASGSERKRLSFLSYADIINDSQGHVLDLDESILREMQADASTLPSAP